MKRKEKKTEEREKEKKRRKIVSSFEGRAPIITLNSSKQISPEKLNNFDQNSFTLILCWRGKYYIKQDLEEEHRFKGEKTRKKAPIDQKG